MTSKIKFIEGKRFCGTAAPHPMNKQINILKRPLLTAALKFAALGIFSNALAAQTSSVQTHRFNMESCGFSLQINVATWERQIKVFDTYVASKTKIAADLLSYYRENFPQVFNSERVRLDKSVAGVLDIFHKNMFPEMKVRGTAYPDGGPRAGRGPRSGGALP